MTDMESSFGGKDGRQLTAALESAGKALKYWSGNKPLCHQTSAYCIPTFRKITRAARVFGGAFGAKSTDTKLPSIWKIAHVIECLDNIVRGL
jgi:hypothetical protein